VSPERSFPSQVIAQVLLLGFALWTGMGSCPFQSRASRLPPFTLVVLYARSGGVSMRQIAAPAAALLGAGRAAFITYHIL